MSSFVLRRVNDITKSAEDKRLYRGLELNNRMKVLLISDPSTDKSAAALDVNVGKFLQVKTNKRIIVIHYKHLFNLADKLKADNCDGVI